VLAAERALLAAEGSYHVEGRFYASASDADRQRRHVAERIVREAARRAEYERGTQGHQRAASAARTPAPHVVTWLTTYERARLDLAAAECGGCLVAVHRDTLAEVRADLVAGEADAVLVSAARLVPADVPTLTSLVRGFPGAPVFGFLAEADEAQAVTGALLLGRAGARGVLDVRTPEDWQVLRATFAPRRLPDAFLRECVASVLAEIRDGDVHDDSDGTHIADGLARFFCLAFAPDITSAKTLAARLGVHPTTLMCRFFRAGLPSPRRYVALARLTWAAWLGEQPGRRIADIAHRLDVSSPSSFHRTVRLLTGRSAPEFRRTTTGRAMLDQYRAALVTPYRATLRAFDPTAGEPTRRRLVLVNSVATGRAA
jgi:AraC-like DNA-binding protein